MDYRVKPEEKETRLQRSCIDTITALLDTGSAIAEGFEKTNDVEVIAIHAPMWTNAVTDFLTKSLGGECAARFRNAPAYVYALPHRDFIGNSYWQHVQGKLRTLSHILVELREQKLSVLAD